jgi:hypothetical protein
LDSSFAKIILWWSPFKILSGSPVLGPRWTLLLFINDSLHSSNWPSSFRDDDFLNFIPLFIFSNSNHVGWGSRLPDTILEGDHLRECHFIYYILRSYCWSHEFSEILPWIGNNMHALNPTCLLQSAFNPTCLFKINDFPTHLYLGKLARKWCELGKDGKSNTFISLEVQ